MTYYHLFRKGFYVLLYLGILFILTSAVREETQSKESLPLQVEKTTPELVVQNGSIGSITAIFSKDGRFVLTSDVDSTVRLWDSESGLLIREFNDAGPAISLSPDANLAATSDPNSVDVLLWDTATGEKLLTLTGHESGVNSIDFSPDGSLIVTGGTIARLWDVKTGKQLQILAVDPKTAEPISESIMQHFLSFRFLDVEFSPNGRYILTGSNDGIARLWDIETGAEIRQFQGHERYSDDGSRGLVYSVAFSPAGDLVLTGSGDRTARIWDVETGQEIHQFKAAFPVSSVDFSKDGKYILTGENHGGTARLWHIDSGKVLKEFNNGQDGVNSVAFSPDNQSVLLGDWAFDIRGRTVIDLNQNLPADDASSAQLFNRETGKLIRRFEGVIRPVEHADSSSDQQYLVTSSPPLKSRSEDGAEVQVWDLNLGRQIGRQPYYQGKIDRLAYLPNSDDFLLFLNGSDIPEIRNSRNSQIANLPSIPRILDYSTNGESWLVQSDSGELVLVSGKNNPFMLDLSIESQYVHAVPDSQTFFFVDFSPNGSYMATAHRQGNKEPIRIWHTDPLQMVNQYDGFEELLDIDVMLPNLMWTDFHPTKKLLLAGGRDQTIRLWDFEQGNEVWRYQDQDTAYRVEFAPNGLWFVVAHKNDGDVYIFDTETHSQLARLKRDGTQILCLDIPSDSSYLITCSRNNLIQFWDPNTGNELARIAMLRNGNWLVIDPNTGRFDTNDMDLIRGLHWVFPDNPFRVLPIEIFMRDFFTPGLLHFILTRQELPQITSLENLNRVQPIVEITSVEEGPRPNEVFIDVKVSSNHGGFLRNGQQITMTTDAYDLRLFRDGQLVGQYPESDNTLQLINAIRTEEQLQNWREFSKVKKEIVQFQVRLPTQESHQRFRFSAYAFNEDRVKSQTVYTDYITTSPLEPREHRAYVVTIGVGDKQASKLNEVFKPLYFTGESALRMQKVLPDMLVDSGEFKEDEIVTISLISNLLDDEGSYIRPTKSNIETVFALLAGQQVGSGRLSEFPDQLLKQIRRVEPNDSVYIFFSSHGYTDPQANFYLIPYDSGMLPIQEGKPLDEQITPEYLARTISSYELANWLQPMDAGHLVMIIDACRSAAFKGEGFKPGPMGDPGLGQLSYDKGMQVLTATQGENDAIGSGASQLSLLTRALVEAMEQNNTLTEGRFNEKAWFQDAVVRVPRLYAELVPEDEQTIIQQPVLFDFTERIVGQTTDAN